MWNRLVRQTAVPLGNELSTHSFCFPLALPARHNAKVMPSPPATKETKFKQVLESAARIPRIDPEYLQLGMSEAAPGITFHQCQTNCDFQVASSVLYELIREEFWKHQRPVSYPSVPAQRAAANHEFCYVYVSLRDQLGVSS